MMYLILFCEWIPIFAVLGIASISAQNFGECDFYKELMPEVVYTFTSPNYKNPYRPGMLCRYTGKQATIIHNIKQKL